MVVLNTLRILAYWPLILLIDKLSALGESRNPSEFRRLYAENLALKACNEALRKELRKAKGKRTAMPIRARALQVLGYLLNRNNVRFQKRYLGTCRSTVRIWTTRFRHPFRKPKNRGGRPPIDPKIVAMILQIKRDNPRFGSVKIAKTLAQMGIQVSRYTVAKVLRENGFDPTGIHQHPWEKMGGRLQRRNLGDGLLLHPTTKRHGDDAPRRLRHLHQRNHATQGVRRPRLHRLKRRRHHPRQPVLPDRAPT